MRHRKAGGGLITLAVVGIVVGACARNPKPKTLGDDPALAPSLEVKSQERGAPHLLLQLPKAAYINAFLVTPGEETLILYPTDAATAPRLEAGSHEITTSFAQRGTGADTGRILRGPTGLGRAGGGGGAGAAGGGRGQGGGGFQVQDRRWVLVYASQDSVPVAALRQKVMGFSVPGYSDEALNTVARMVRSIVPRGPWAAVAVEYVP